jgi:transcriptional regulator with XRE-family HTH domain
MRTDLLSQIKKLRLKKALTISAMPLLTGLTRQQYGKIEAGGNPSLSTLDAIVEALGASLVLVPKDRVGEVMDLLAQAPGEVKPPAPLRFEVAEERPLYKPFKDL